MKNIQKNGLRKNKEVTNMWQYNYDYLSHKLYFVREPKKDHKYIDKVFENGKWNYIYDTGKGMKKGLKKITKNIKLNISNIKSQPQSQPVETKKSLKDVYSSFKENMKEGIKDYYKSADEDAKEFRDKYIQWVSGEISDEEWYPYAKDYIKRRGKDVADYQAMMAYNIYYARKRGQKSFIEDLI